MNNNPLEKEIEKAVCDYAKSLGCLVYKFTSPARRSVPDRLFITPKGIVFFIEFKRLGGVPTAAQTVEIEKIRKTGVSVWVVDEKQEGKTIVRLVVEGKMTNAFKAPGKSGKCLSDETFDLSDY